VPESTRPDLSAAAVESDRPRTKDEAEKMLGMLKRHEIQVLRRAGLTQAEVAKLAGVSERSVRRVQDEPAITSVEPAPPKPAQRRVGRPAKVERFRSFVVAELTKDPHVMSLELLRRAKLAGYDGGKSALYAHIKELRPERPRPMVRFEGLPGEFTQHDFGQVDVSFINGTKKRIRFFASRLKYSRWVQVSIVDNEQAETLARTMVDHFAAIGGIPLLAVFDRPKTIAVEWNKDGQVTQWNSIFAGVALDLGLGVELCWPHSPEQKGSVENLVGWVKGSFFKPRRFVDEDDLRLQLAEWHVEANTKRPCRATGGIPEARMAEERARLRPLKVAPDELALRVPVSVGPTGYVDHEGRTYSVDPEAIGVPGTLYLYRTHVRIVCGRFSVEHARINKGEKSTLPQHRPKQVAAVSGQRAKRYLKRQHLLELGGAALDYLTELVHRRPRVWSRDVDRMHDLLQQHGAAALLAAFDRGLADGNFGHEYIAHYLETLVPQQKELFP
jgi:transposase